MKVNWDVNDNVWIINMELEEDDPVEGGGQGTMKVRLLSNSARIILPRKIETPHPDLMAFASLVISRPWIGKNLFVTDPVSKEFADTVKKLLKIDVQPVDDSLERRNPGKIPVLSFSGGVDSVAASQVLPSGIPHVHFSRIDHRLLPNKAPHVRTDAILDIVIESKKRGYNSDVVYSDLEHICSPYPTLPHWFAIAVGILLMADNLDAGAVALGGTLETFYMDMGRKWTGEGGKGLEPLAEVVGLPFFRPMLGVTEIGTMNIALQSNLGDIARSCVLGTRESPCGVCTKCVRKMMTSAVFNTGCVVPKALAELSSDQPGLKSLLEPPPYYMQAQLEYTLARIKNLTGFLESLYERLGKPTPSATSWMDGYYLPALERSVPYPWRETVLDKIEGFIPIMSEDDIQRAHSWDRSIIM